MSRSTYTRTTCDACGCYCKDGMSGTINVDTRLEENEDVDLCLRCMQQEIQAQVSTFSESGRKNWVWKMKKKPSV